MTDERDVIGEYIHRMCLSQNSDMIFVRERSGITIVRVRSCMWAIDNLVYEKIQERLCKN